MLRAPGGTFWWSSIAPERLTVSGLDSTAIEPLRVRLVATVPDAGGDDAEGSFVLKADGNGAQILAPVAFRRRSGRVDAVGFLADGFQYSDALMRPAAESAQAARFGEAGRSIVGWRVVRPGGDTSLAIGHFDAAAPMVSLDFLRPRNTVNTGSGLSFMAPATTLDDSLSTEHRTDPRRNPFRVLVQVNPASIGEFLYGSREGPRMAIAILLFAALSLTTATVLLARRFVRHVREREAFATAVAHELRTPLTQILLYGESLQLDRPAVRTKEEAARVIVRETRRLIHLVENALHFVRGGRASPTLSTERLSLDALVAETMEGLQPILDRASVSVALQLEPVSVRADRNALVQVLTNLVDNAVRFGPRNQTLLVRVRREGNQAVLEVDDEGPGIPRTLRDAVFEPFVRTGPSQGTGIGLAVSRQLVELMDGTLTADEASSGGAQLRLTLTVAPAPLVAPAPSTQPMA